jgi:hypothetical protein
MSQSDHSLTPGRAPSRASMSSCISKRTFWLMHLGLSQRLLSSSLLSTDRELKVLSAGGAHLLACDWGSRLSVFSLSCF